MTSSKHAASNTASSHHNTDRALQQDARAWQAFTGQSYTASLRQLEAPYAQGILGERVSARRLIEVLNDHPVIGARGGNPAFGSQGLSSEDPMSSIVKQIPERIFSEVVWSTELLRMFTPVSTETFNNKDGHSRANSYRLKHTAERFAGSHVGGYVANGSLIWAAAALGLPMCALEDKSPNVLIGIPDQEHLYVRKLVNLASGSIRDDHYRPPGLTRLQESLARLSAGESLDNLPPRESAIRTTSPFHDWLIRQQHRRGWVGIVAHDYNAGVEDSDHRPAASAADLLQILREVPCDPENYLAAGRLVAEWRRRNVS